MVSSWFALLVTITVVSAQRGEEDHNSHVAVKAGTATCNGILIAKDVTMVIRDCLVMLQFTDEPISVWTTGDKDTKEMRWVSATSDTEKFQAGTIKIPSRELVLLFLSRPFDQAGITPPEDWAVDFDPQSGLNGDSVIFWTIAPCASNSNSGCAYKTFVETSAVAVAPNWPYTGANPLTSLQVTRQEDYWVVGNVMCPAGCGSCSDWGAPVTQLGGRLTGMGRGGWCGTIDGDTTTCISAGLTVVHPSRNPTKVNGDPDGNFCTTNDNWIGLSTDDKNWAEAWIEQQESGSVWEPRLPANTRVCNTHISTSSNERHNVDSASVCLTLDQDVNEIWVTLPKGFEFTDSTSIDNDRLWGVKSRPAHVKLFPGAPGGDDAHQVQLRWTNTDVLLNDDNNPNPNRIVYFEIENVRNPNNCAQNGKWSIAQWNCRNTDLLGSGTTMVRRCPVSPSSTHEFDHDVNTYPTHCNLCNACRTYTKDSNNNYLMKCEHDGVKFFRSLTKDNGKLVWPQGEECFYMNGVDA